MKLLRVVLAAGVVSAAAAACSQPTAPAEPSIPLPYVAPSFEDQPAPPRPSRQPNVGPRFGDLPSPPNP